MKPIRSVAGQDESRASLWNQFLFIAVLVWTFLSLCFPLYDTDFWWHLRTGEWILSGNGIPYVDLYTFTDSDKAWIDLHWGFQVLVTVLYWMGGIPLVTLVKAGVYTAAIGFGWYAGGDKLPPWKKAALWILPIICISGRGNERPEMLTQLFLAIWLWLARKTDERPRWIWYLPLVHVVWVNCHALSVLGLVVGVCYGIDAVLRQAMKGRWGLEPRTAGPPLKTVGIVAGLVVAACFVNPYFEEGALFPLVLYRKFSVEKEFYSKSIGEFTPPIVFLQSSEHAWKNIYLQAELWTWVLTAFSFVWLFARRRRWSPLRLLLFAGFSHLAWQATRNTNVFAFVSAFVACENFADAERFSTVPAKSQVTLRQLRWTQLMSVVVGLLGLMVVTGVWNQIGEKNKPFRLGEAPNWFIHNAAKFAAQPGFPDRAFVANNGQAEVYVYHNGPAKKVFMDARLEVCTQQTFERYLNILRLMSEGSTLWEGLFRKEGLPVVILDSRVVRSAINGMLNIRTWRLVYADQAAAVFLPVPLAEQLHLPQADPTPLIDPDGQRK